MGEQRKSHTAGVDSLAVSADAACIVSCSGYDWAGRASAPRREPWRRRSARNSPSIVLLTAQDGSGITRLSTLVTGVRDGWLFDESRRILWVCLDTGGPVWMPLVE
jgi:hypothetical protein